LELSLMTAAEVAEYLGTCTLALIPLGSTEQHGALAPVSCDAAVAGAICRRAAGATRVVCAPVLHYGFSECHTGFPGTASLSRETMQAVIEDIVESLALHRFRTILFLSGHGGNRSPVEAAIKALGESHPGLRMLYMGYWNLPGAQELEQRLFEGRSGFHATAAEVSMYMHLFPGFQPPPEALKQYPPSPAGPMTAQEWIEAFPDGPAGVDARQISPGKGAELFDFLCRALAGVLAELAGGCRA
jgi:creatinine amidohydrolase